MIWGVGIPVALHLMDNALRVTAVTLDPISTVNEPLLRSLRDLSTVKILGDEVSENNKHDGKSYAAV